jgi:large repetitive protein
MSYKVRSGSVQIPRRAVIRGLATMIAAPAVLGSPGRVRATPSWEASWLDGRAAAPAGDPQYPTYFTGLNRISAYRVRPPWQVAGVDYRVGINPGIPLKHPAMIKPSIAVSSGKDPVVLNLVTNDVTLDHYDFTLGGWWQIRSNGHTNLKISNSRLENLCIDMDAGPVTIEYCEIDGLGLEGETAFGCLAFLRTGVTSTWKYNWLRRAQNDFIDLSTSDIDVRFNLFDTMGYADGAHADAVQFAGDGIANHIRILFNTYVHTAVTNSSPSSFIDLETQVGSGNQVMNNPEIAYNTASYVVPGRAKGSTFFRVAQDVGAINNAYIHDNYADPTNMLSVISESPSPGHGYSKMRNVLLTSGRSF